MSLIRPGEHVAVLRFADRFCSLHRRDGYFDEGVVAIFGVERGTAELQALRFHPRRFTPSRARTWLAERGFRALLFTEGSGP